MSDQEKIKEALVRIDQGLENINTNEDWLAFLRFQAQFYSYSAGNAMLIFMQNPQASYVMGYRAWNKLGRFVRKGEKAISIIAPCFRKVTEFKEPEDKRIYNDEAGEKEKKRIISGFRLAYVFDLAQTEGDDSQLPVLVRGLAGNGQEEQELYYRLKDFVSSKLPFEEVSGTASKGSYSIETGVVSVRSDLDYLQKIKTVLHEYAHHVDFRLNPDKDIPRNKRELIAESVAFVVSLRLGVDTSGYTMGYLKTWLKDRDELKEIADSVQKIASIIIKELAGSEYSAFSNLKEV